MKTRREFFQLTGSIAAGTALYSCLPGIRTETGNREGITFTDVYRSGTDGYHTYRIPAVLVTDTGSLLAFCEGRKNSRSDHGDIDLLVKRSTDGGRTWSAQQIVYEEGGTAEITIGNPCPVLERQSGTIWLPFTRNNDDVFVTRSKDDGVTWVSPVRITPEVKKSEWSWYATGPGVGIQIQHGLREGRMVIPCDHREAVKGDPVKFSHVFYSDDGGTHWQLGGAVARHTDECQVVELPDQRLMINMRNYRGREGNQPEQGNTRAVAYSRDGGETWSDILFDETLIEPVCQASFIRYSWPQTGNRSRILFSNPASTDERVQMTVRMSYDEGQTWPVRKLIYPGSSAYSCLTKLPDGQIGCLFERGQEHPYETITFARISLKALENES